MTAGEIFTSSYTYEESDQSPIFGALLTETDTLGHQTKYFYDASNGELLAQIDVDSGNGYVYEYSASGELQSVYPATGTLTEYTKTTNAENVNYEYDPNTHRLSKIITDSTEYSFSYNLYGNSSGVTVGNDTLATYEYYSNNGKLKKINYGNGFSEQYRYNTLEMLSEIWYTYDDNDETGVKAYSYLYNKDGSLAKFTNHLDGTSIEYEYDVHGRLISSVEIDSSDTDYKNDYVIEIYDAEGRIRKSHNYVNYLSSSGLATVDLDGWYEFNTNGTLHREQLGYASTNSLAIYYYYDDFGRLTRTYRRAGDVVIDSTYTYVSDGTNTSNLIATYTNKVGLSTTTITYEYDSLGNITSVDDNGNETTYTYDDLGQLTKEHYGRITRNYSYDTAGNITSIQVVEVNPNTDQTLYALLPLPGITTTTTTTLSYTDSQWGDLLTSYDGTAITYDQIGNPLTYYNGSAYTFTWEGRKLVGATKGSNNLTFVYNDEGIRTSKTVNGVKHTYYLNGSQIVAEQWADKLLVFTYDASGSPIGMSFRNDSYAADQWDVYWFEKNLQGDILSVYDSTGQQVAYYSYHDAWGNHTDYTTSSATEGARYNPFRYRGYYYDTDLGMYYLQSRYYDAKICRFISPDYADVITATPMALTDKNLYAYCDNNPVMRIDNGGAFWHIAVGAVAGALISVVVKVVSNAIEGKSLTDGLATAMLSGAASGALASTGVGIVGMVAGNAAISMAENTANQIIENKGFNNFDVGDMLIDGAIGGVLGALGGAGKGTKHLTNLGKQTVKRTFNVTTHKGLKAGLEEAGKAFAYYGKNTTKYYTEFLRGIRSDVIVSIGTAIASSNYMKHQYRRVFGR